MLLMSSEKKKDSYYFRKVRVHMHIIFFLKQQLFILGALYNQFIYLRQTLDVAFLGCESDQSNCNPQNYVLICVL